jgi:hypothetical protein
MPVIKDKITGKVVSRQPYNAGGMQNASTIAESNPNWEMTDDYPQSNAPDRMENISGYGISNPFPAPSNTNPGTGSPFPAPPIPLNTNPYDDYPDRPEGPPIEYKKGGKVGDKTLHPFQPDPLEQFGFARPFEKGGKVYKNKKGK